MISVICCYNKLVEYDQMRKSLEMQDVDYELVAVRNNQNQFPSASAALNWGAARAHGEILVFLHQDIVFCKNDSLRRLTEYLMQEDIPCTMIGLFGAARTKVNCVQKLKVCETLDECCVAVTKATWEKIKFNEVLCDGWHLYVVEFCIRLRRIGGQVLSGAFDIVHLSSGNVDEAYMKTYKAILIQYKDEKWICTTCKTMPTNLLFFYCYYCLWKVKKILLGNYNLVYKIKQIVGKGKV